MKKLFRTLLEHLQADEPVVLCCILASSGSTPRGAGAKMAVFQDGSTIGTIGGGAIELHAIREAMKVHESKKDFAKGFCLRPNDVADIGMICGGDVKVYFQYLDSRSVEKIQTVLRVLDGTTDAWLCYTLEEGVVTNMGVYEQGVGLLHADKSLEPLFEPHLQGSVVYKAGKPTLYVEPLVTQGRVYVFGCGHVAKELVPVLTHIGFAVTVIDPRPHLANREQFPDAKEILLEDFNNINDYLTITESDYVVIMTPGHQGDFEVLDQTLRTPARYVGCIGSKHKVAGTKQRLLEAGVTPEQIEKMISPIGFDLGGRTPAEIAISIAAQMMACRYSKPMHY